MNNSDIQELQNQLVELYQRAESEIKNSEYLFSQTNQETFEGLAFPVINELRYAGNHVIRAIDSDNADAAHENYNKAISHCVRAVYDVYDAQILYVLGEIAWFNKEYSKTVITNAIPNYIELLNEVSKIRDSYARRTDSKEEDWRLSLESLTRLKEILGTFNTARSELNKHICQKNWEWIISVVAILLSLTSLLMQWFGE
ncbi:MAG: hypothetical protein Q4D38_00320 [Planctomycetia bacterium]|nr:hypothetical protein [Planctomycetia bacterium]